MLARTPAGNSGQASAPTGNPGLAAASLAKVREAVHLLELALPDLETGSDSHKAVIESIQKISKAVPPSQEIPGVQKSALMELQQRQGQNAALQQLQAQMAAKSQAAQQPQPSPAPAQAAAQ
jgi:hypothetical protein